VEHCGLDVLDFPATKLAKKLAFGMCCSLWILRFEMICGIFDGYVCERLSRRFVC
jgi:hypothetical protein